MRWASTRCTSTAADDADLERLRDALHAHRDDPRLVAVGEIGLDHFVPGLDRARQQRFYLAQLKLARDAGLPVILHVRRSADALLQGPAPHRRCAAASRTPSTAARCRRGSSSSAGLQARLRRRHDLRARAADPRAWPPALPETALVLETDAPDIPPQWLYRTAAERAAGAAGRNEPAELPRIAAVLAALRGWRSSDTARSHRGQRARRAAAAGARLTRAAGDGWPSAARCRACRR